jgi:hypothetical protein
MELIPASGAGAVWQAAIRSDCQDTIADSALADALEVQTDVLTEQCEGVDDGAALCSVSIHIIISTKGVYIPGS